MEEDSTKPYTYLKPSRVDPLKDYSNDIFAFSATLLIINLVVPSIPQEDVDTRLAPLLLAQWHHFAIYIISFLNISNYWAAHSAIFENIVCSNRVLTRLNIFLLLSVTFLPYPSMLMSQYGRHSVVALVYGLSISFTYLMLTLITCYAYSNDRLTRPEIHLPVRRIIMLREVIPLILALTGTLLSYLFPKFSFIIYLLVSLFFFLPRQLFMRGVTIISPSSADED